MNCLVNKAALDVLAERSRQIAKEGWTPEHDDEHTDGQMAAAAASYAVASAAPGVFHEGLPPALWPWSSKWWKPGERRRMLVKAGALILAEIERIDRRTHEADDLVEPRRPVLEAMGFAPGFIEEMKSNLQA